MCRAFRSLVWVQSPFDVVLDKAMTEHGTGMVEHDRIDLTGRGSKHAADHLAVQTHFLCRPGQDAAGYFWHVPALGQHHAVGDHFHFARGQSGKNSVALLLRHRAVDVLGSDAGFDKFVADM